MEAVLRQNPFVSKRLGQEVVGGRNEREVVAIDRELLAEADYGAVDFERGTP